jgi:hypothetical protein
MACQGNPLSISSVAKMPPAGQQPNSDFMLGRGDPLP